MSKKADTTGGGAARQEPKDASPTALAAVSGLMEERRRYDSWLAGLEARRDTTPPAVFARVHADYTTRLEAVVAQLVTHVEGLRAEVRILGTRLASLRDEQQQARDARAEAELRAHVGELTAEEWEATARAADERIDALVSRHADVETDLQRTRDLLADAERPATPHLSSPAVPDVGRVASSAPDTTRGGTAGVDGVSDSAEAAMHVPAASPAARSGADAQSSRKASPRQTDEQAPGELPPAVIAAEAALTDELPAGAGESTEGPRPGSASFDELAFLNSVVDTPAKETTAPAAAPPAVERKAPAREEPAPVRRESYAARPKDSGIENLDATADRSILSQPSRKGTPMAANISGNNPIVLRDKSPENAKTLKCADCSAMNYPTEWYCERCGAELASL